MRRFALAILLIIAALVAAVPVLAHAKLLASRPSANETLSVAPGRIELEFNSRIQRLMSSISIKDASGENIAIEPLVTSDDGKTLSAALPTLGPGEYKVTWRSLSADDHMIEGEFVFRIGEAAAAQTPGEPSIVDHAAMDHSMHGGEENVSWPQSLVRWLLYMAMMVVAGGLVFRVIIFPEVTSEATAIFPRQAMRVLLVASSVLIASLFVSLVLQVDTVFGSLEPANFYSVLAETTLGVPWMIQMASALGVIVVLVFKRRAAALSILDRVALGFSFATLLGPSLTGHARAASADYPFTVLADWLHLAGAAVWTGGLVMVFIFALSSTIRERPGLLADVVRKFNKPAIAATLLLALTGVYNSWIHVESFSALIETLYGRVLLAKVGVSVLMVVLGGINAFVLQPRIRRSVNGGGPDRSLARNVAVEVALGAVVLLLAAILAFLPPAREHRPIATLSNAFSRSAA